MFHLLMRLVTPNSSEPLSTITQPEVRRTPCSQKEDTPTNISHARLYFVCTSLAIASEHSQQNPSLLQSEHLCSYSSNTWQKACCVTPGCSLWLMEYKAIRHAFLTSAYGKLRCVSSSCWPGSYAIFTVPAIRCNISAWCGVNMR